MVSCDDEHIPGELSLRAIRGRDCDCVTQSVEGGVACQLGLVRRACCPCTPGVTS